MWYLREFSTFDEDLSYIYRDLNVPETWDYRTQGMAFQRWIDNSWHNDSCPRFGYIVGAPYDEEFNLDLFVDFVDPERSMDTESRLDGSFKRYHLSMDGSMTFLLQTDDWKEMLFFIRGYVDALKAACVALAEVDIKQATLYKKLQPVEVAYYKANQPSSEQLQRAVDIFLEL